MTGAIPFSPYHRDLLERYAAAGCAVSRYMLDHGVWFAEALEALHRERCAQPVPVPDEETTNHGEEWR